MSYDSTRDRPQFCAATGVASKSRQLIAAANSAFMKIPQATLLSWRNVQFLRLVRDIDMQVPEDIHPEDDRRLGVGIWRRLDVRAEWRRLEEQEVGEIGDDADSRVGDRNPLERERFEDVLICPCV